MNDGDLLQAQLNNSFVNYAEAIFKKRFVLKFSTMKRVSMNLLITRHTMKVKSKVHR